MLDTAGPTSSTSPTPSWPRIRPSVTVGTCPFMMWRSLPQIVVRAILTTASEGSLTFALGFCSHDRTPAA